MSLDLLKRHLRSKILDLYHDSFAKDKYKAVEPERFWLCASALYLKMEVLMQFSENYLCEVT